MSPEQIDLADESADTRSDVYSLGVLLYVLLAGVLPFEPDALCAGGLEHLRQLIREQNPKTPSTRLTALGEEAVEVAGNRRTDVRALAQYLHKELEWIPLKAMRKERDERYQSASELAQDIRNYLSGVPLLAGPPTVAYRFRKFVKRNRVSVAAVASIGLVIAVGCAISLTLYIRARVQAERTEAVSDLLIGPVLGALSPYRAQGGEVTPVSVLDGLATALEDRFGDAPLTEARVRHALGMVYWGNAEFDKAAQQLRRALDLRRREIGDDDLQTVSSMFRLGMALLYACRSREAEPLFLEAVAHYHRALGADHSQTLFATTIMAWNYTDLGEYDEAIRLSQHVLQAVPNSESSRETLKVRAMYTIGLARAYQGLYTEAEKWLAKAVEGVSHVKSEDHGWFVNFPGLAWKGLLATGQIHRS